jgi:hypothetical protein
MDESDEALGCWDLEANLQTDAMTKIMGLRRGSVVRVCQNGRQDWPPRPQTSGCRGPDMFLESLALLPALWNRGDE